VKEVLERAGKFNLGPLCPRLDGVSASPWLVPISTLVAEHESARRLKKRWPGAEPLLLNLLRVI
jgi:hypothetical protein